MLLTSMGTRLTTIIVDDEKSARSSLARRLADVKHIDLAGSARNGREALQMISELAPDLVLLDIQMPGMDGFDVLRALDEDRLPVIIFVTAFDEFASQELEKHELDCLSKPIDGEQLMHLLEKARHLVGGKGAAGHRRALAKLASGIGGDSARSMREIRARRKGSGRSAETPKLAIRDGGSTTWVPQDEIEWIDAAGDYMCVHAGGKTHILRITMKKLEQQLDPAILQRIHRSTIVNIHCVCDKTPHINGEFFLTLKNGHQVKLSRSYRDRLRYFR